MAAVGETSFRNRRRKSKFPPGDLFPQGRSQGAVAVKLDFIRPGRPVQNAFIESFSGRLRDECLNREVFFSLKDAREKIERWRRDYNQKRRIAPCGIARRRNSLVTPATGP